MARIGDVLPSTAARVAMSPADDAQRAPHATAASVRRWACALAVPTATSSDDGFAGIASPLAAAMRSDGSHAPSPSRPASGATAGADAPTSALSCETESPSMQATPILGPEVVHSDAPEFAAGRAVALGALRDEHVSHRETKPDMSAPGLRTTANSDSARDAATDDVANVATWTLLDWPPPAIAQAPSPTAPETHTGTDALQSLIESCCDRLWVSDGRGGTPSGVMLDLGRWMPGCTIEVARAAGVLRLQMRGVDDVRRREVEQRLGALGEALAEKLGCQVVSAVEPQQEPQR